MDGLKVSRKESQQIEDLVLVSSQVCDKREKAQAKEESRVWFCWVLILFLEKLVSCSVCFVFCR